MGRREFLAAGASALGLLGVAAVALPRYGRLPTDAPSDLDAGALVGRTAPQLMAPTTQGPMWDSAAFAGRPIWINVWATWCPPCRTEMPEIDEVTRAANADGLAFLALNFEEGRGVIEEYLANTRYGFTIGLDETGEIAGTLGVRTLPAHIFIARSGLVEAIRIGGMTRAEMEAHVLAITGGQRA